MTTRYQTKKIIKQLEEARAGERKKKQKNTTKKFKVPVLDEELRLSKLSVKELKKEVTDQGYIINHPFFKLKDATTVTKGGLVKGLLKVFKQKKINTKVSEPEYIKNGLQRENINGVINLNKFKAFKFIIYHVASKTNLVNIIFSKFEELKKEKYNFYLSVSGWAETRGVIDDNIQAPRDYILQKIPTKIVSSRSDIKQYINDLVHKNEEILMNRAQKSDTFIEISEFRELHVFLKLVKKTQGGKYVTLSEDLENFLYNPKSNGICFYEALKHHTDEVDIKFSVSEVISKIGTFSPVSAKGERNCITKIIQEIDPRLKVVLYTLKPDFTINNPTTYPYNAGKTEKKFIVKMFLHKNHFMLITDFKKFQTHKFSESDFVVKEEKPEMMDEERLKNVPIPFTKFEHYNDKSELTDNCYVYDLETFTDDRGNHHIYAAGLLSFKEEEPIIFYGMDSGQKLADYMKELAKKQDEKFEISIKNQEIENEYQTNRLRKAYQLRFFAHNGARYDSLLLKKYIDDTDEMLEKNGLIFYNFAKYNVLLDSMRHLPVALDKLCGDFKLDKKFVKTAFPYDFLNENRDINYKGPIPEKKYWKDKKIPDFIKEKEVYDLKSECIEYLKLDLISLTKILTLYAENVFKFSNLNPLHYVTAPSIAYQYCLKTWNQEFKTEEQLDEKFSEAARKGREKINEIAMKKTKKGDLPKTQQIIKTIKNKDVDRFIRESIVGGRVFVQKQEFVSKDYTDLFQDFNKLEEKQKEKLFNSVKDFRHDFDAVSLYPSAMNLFQYPTGDAYKILKEDFPLLIEQINNLQYDKHCIIRATIKYKNVRKYCTALLSRKIDKSNVFDFCEKTIVSTSVDIMEAIKFNDAYVSNIEEGIEWKESNFVFKNVIGSLFETRQKARNEGNKALATTAKMMMNSIYGGFIKGIITEETKIVKTNEDLDKMILSHDCWFNISENETYVGFDKEIEDSDIKTPSHLGVFILAYSKKIMNNCISLFDGFTNWKNTFYYMDTDSMVISNVVYEYLKQKRVEYPLFAEEQEIINDDQLGSLHSDLDLKDAKIIRAYFIAPKLYMLEYIGYNKDTNLLEKKLHSRSKGVNLYGYEKEELIEQYQKMLDGEKITYVGQKVFKRENLRNPNTDKGKETGIQTLTSDKVINQRMWKGRKHNPEKKRFEPFTPEDFE